MAISDELTRIQTAKADIKASIEAKGVTVPSDALIDTYSNYVDEIQTGGGGGQAEQDLIDLIEGDIVTLNIPNGITKIKDYAFADCTSLTSVTIPNSVTSICSNAFNNCGFTEITIPNSVTTIGIYAFNYCRNLTSVTIPNSVTSIDSNVFYRCISLTSITIPNSVTSIGNNAFGYCSGLTSVTIPNSVTSIGNAAFADCTSLTSIVIPDSITRINSYVFNSCTSLTSITIQATTPPTLHSTAFNNTNNCPIYVPAESVDTYKTATNWSSYASRIQAIPAE